MSSKNKLVFYLFMLCIFLLVPSSALAAEDFTVKSINKVVSMCSCETIKDSFVIKNIGSVSSTYKIKAEGAAAKWTEFSPERFTLRPGKSARIINQIEPRCGTTGTFDLMVVITTQSGLQKAFLQNIKTSRCINLGVGIKDNDLKGCQCSDFTYDFIIVNTGNYTDTYSFSVEPFSEFTEIEPASVSIESRKKKTVSVKVQPPCDILGPYNLNFTTRTEKSRLLAITPFSLTPEQCYDYELIAEDSDVCADALTLYNIIIENTADFTNNYTLFLDAPDWVVLENKTIELEEGYEGSFTLNFNPAKLGIYEMDVRVVAEKEEVLKNKTISLNVTDCYSFNLDIPVKKDKICCGMNSYDVILNNTGIEENEINISVDREDASLSRGYVVLDPGQAKSVRLNTDFPCENKKYEVTVTGASSETGVSSSDTIILDVLTGEQCYVLDFKDKSARTGYGDSSSVLRFRNKGIKFATYVFSLLDAPSWVSLESTTFELGMKDRAELLILSSASEEIPEDNYLVSLQADAEGVTYKHDFILKLRHGKPLFETLKDFFISFLYYIIGAVVIIILVLVLIKVVRESKARGLIEEISEEKKEEPIKEIEKKEEFVEKKIVEWRYLKLLKIILTVLIILTFIIGSFFIYYGSFYQPPLNEAGEKTTTFGDDLYIIFSNFWAGMINYTYVNETTINETEVIIPESFLYQVWDAYTTKTINLSEHIVDPDGDVLEFSVTEEDNIHMNLEDGILELTPEDGWHGETSMVVTAIDSRGGKVNVIMTFFVREAPKPYPVAETYLDFVAIGIVLLVLIIGIVREYEKRTSKKNRKYKKRK